MSPTVPMFLPSPNFAHTEAQQSSITNKLNFSFKRKILFLLTGTPSG